MLFRSVVSNRESGYGRFNLAMFPKNAALPGILMEFKAVESEEALEQATDAALQQMDEKAYVTELEAAGVQTIWRYGVAFCKKHVLIQRA